MKDNIPSLSKPGRPSRLTFSDLFLISPRHEYELNGISLNNSLPEESVELKNLLQDLGRKNRSISKRRAESLLPLLSKFVSDPVALEKFSAFFGNECSPLIGEWESYITGCFASIPNNLNTNLLQHISRIIIEREHALRAPTKAFYSYAFVECANLLENSPSIRPFLCDNALQQFREARQPNDLIVVRMLVAIEIRLSGIAYWDAVLCKQHGFYGPYFMQFFPKKDDTSNSVGFNYFDWLAKYSGAERHLAEHFYQLDKLLSDFDLASAKRQVRRWKSGLVFPSNDVMTSCFRSLFDKNSPFADAMKWTVCEHVFEVCRRIKFLMDILEFFPSDAALTPLLTHGAATISDWRDSRYRYWFEHSMKDQSTSSEDFPDKPCPPSN